MNLSSAKNRIPRAVSASGIIHFVFDFCSHNNTTIIPWCCEDRSSIQASFNIPANGRYCIKHTHTHTHTHLNQVRLLGL